MGILNRDNERLPISSQRISFGIRQFSDGSIIPCYLNTDGQMYIGNTAISKTDLPLNASFSYIAK